MTPFARCYYQFHRNSKAFNQQTLSMLLRYGGKEWPSGALMDVASDGADALRAIKFCCGVTEDSEPNFSVWQEEHLAVCLARAASLEHRVRRLGVMRRKDSRGAEYQCINWSEGYYRLYLDDQVSDDSPTAVCYKLDKQNQMPMVMHWTGLEHVSGKQVCNKLFEA